MESSDLRGIRFGLTVGCFLARVVATSCDFATFCMSVVFIDTATTPSGKLSTYFLNANLFAFNAIPVSRSPSLIMLSTIYAA